MADPTKPGQGYDPQQRGSQQQGQQQPDDKELTDFLEQEEGHTEQSAKQELRNNREAVKQRHQKHKEKHHESK